mmetsp:Transcript_49122/g.107005  ORF Transcript_49122/g.107005 Transcript_49122/m.107005 type:complete len:189 (+) Transcript_49122:80-646(+)
MSSPVETGNCLKIGSTSLSLRTGALILGAGGLIYGLALLITGGDLITLTVAVSFGVVGFCGMWGAHKSDTQLLKVFFYCTIILCAIQAIVITYWVVINNALMIAIRDQRCAGLRHEDECKAWFTRTYILGLWAGSLAVFLLTVGCAAWVVITAGNLIKVLDNNGTGDEHKAPSELDVGAPIMEKKPTK